MYSDNELITLLLPTRVKGGTAAHDGKPNFQIGNGFSPQDFGKVFDFSVKSRDQKNLNIFEHQGRSVLLV